MSTVKIAILAATGLLLLSLLVFGLSEVLHEQREEQSVISVRVHAIVVDAAAGDVDVRAGLTANVVIDRTDSWILERPGIRESLRDGTLHITTDCGGVRSVLRCRTDLAIAAPPEVDVRVRTNAGDVDLRGLSGRADVATDSGDIRTHRLAPVTVRADTDAGDVDLDLFGAPARTEARSDGGDVDVTVPYGLYRVDATAEAGDVKVEGILRDDLAPQAIDALTDVGDIVVRAR